MILFSILEFEFHCILSLNWNSMNGGLKSAALTEISSRLFLNFTKELEAINVSFNRLSTPIAFYDGQRNKTYWADFKIFQFCMH